MPYSHVILFFVSGFFAFWHSSIGGRNNFWIALATPTLFIGGVYALGWWAILTVSAGFMFGHIGYMLNARDSLSTKPNEIDFDKQGAEIGRKLAEDCILHVTEHGEPIFLDAIMREVEKSAFSFSDEMKLGFIYEMKKYQNDGVIAIVNTEHGIAYCRPDLEHELFGSKSEQH